MNNKRRTPIYFILMLIILIACTKQVGLVTEVEFDFLGGNTTEGYVNESLGTTLTVVPEELLEGYTYNFRYSVVSGEGHFEDGNGEPLASGEKHAFDPLSKSLNYIGTTVGTHTVRIQAEDTYGFTEELELTYILSEVPVTWTATSADTELLLGSQTTITVTLGNEGVGNVTYERNYRTTTSSGELTESNGTGVDMDGYVDITPGTYQYDFTAETLGAVGFTFDLRDSNGQELTATVNLEVVEELSSGENDIIAFTLPGQDGTATIDPETHTITVNVPMGTTMTMAPTVLTVSEGATVAPVMDTQQDFSGPVIYTVTAENGDAQEWTVTVMEEAASTDPEITLIGGNLTLTVGGTYLEEGATAMDVEDGDISGDIVIDASAVDTDTVGSYQVTYNVTDSDGNTATEVIRTVTVNAVVNEVPTAQDFTATVVMNSVDNPIDVYSYIADSENDPLTITIADGSPANGTTIVSGTVISYTPDNGFTGDDEITYLVDDGNNPVVSATITITVNAVVVAQTGVEIVESNQTLDVNDTFTFSANILPANTTNPPTVTWSSNNGSVTVNSSGQVTAISEGTATITASAGGFTDSRTVTVNAIVVPQTGVEIVESNQTLDVNDTFTFSANILPANTTNPPTVTWSSNNGSVTVNSSGQATAISEGTATITASAGGFTDSRTVTVNAIVVPQTGVEIVESNQTLDVNDTFTFSANILPANTTNPPTITWSSNNGSVTVNSSGQATAISEGTATITASAGGFTDSRTVTVNAVVVAQTGVEIVESNQTLDVNDTFTFSANILPANTTNPPTVTWSSNNGSVTVNSSGQVTAISEGTATITASAGGFTDSRTVTVNAVSVSTVIVSPSTGSIEVGSTQQYTATVMPANASYPSVTWSSSNPGIATVNSMGLVTGVSAGSVTITATADGVDGNASVSINVPPSYSISITSPNPGPSGYNYGEPVPFNVTITPNQAAIDSGITFTMKFLMNGGGSYFIVGGDNHSEGSVFSVLSGSWSGSLDYGWLECDEVPIIFYVYNNLGLNTQDQTLNILFNDSECP